MREAIEMKAETIVVSMTSFPAAIEFAEEAVQSLLEGSVLPDKIVLYLTFSQFGKDGLPGHLTQLAAENPIFEIRDYPRDIRSYRKLIPALSDFPEACIVTVDDDVHYDKDMLKDLLEIHSQYPEHIVAHRAKKICLTKPYKKWKKIRWYDFLLKRIHLSPMILQTGVAGVLYPPHSLKKDMLDQEVFTKIAPTTDDIWFWAAAIANDRMVMPVPFGKNKPKGLGKPKKMSLKTINFKSGEDRNSEALKNILSYFPEIKGKIINFAENKID